MEDLSSKLYPIIDGAGFRYSLALIHLFVGGSATHGARVTDKGDLDIYGIYIPPPKCMLGLDVDTHFVWTSSSDKVRNTSDDVDINLYSLTKWAGMAAKGNPTALEFLFAPSHADDGMWDKHILPNRPAFLSAHAGFHFQKFSEHMLRVLKGEGVGKRGQRPDLIKDFGYDTKAAMHLIRVLSQGVELMTDHVMTFPRPEKDLLIDIRLGKYKLADIEAMSMNLFAKLEEARLNSSLPNEISRDRISEIITAAHMEFWTGMDWSGFYAQGF